jgi:hypothetical protein
MGFTVCLIPLWISIIRHDRKLKIGYLDIFLPIGAGFGKPNALADRLIASCRSWNDFWEGAKKLSFTSEKGAAFERLTQLYLQTTPEYQSEPEHVWTLREVPLLG